MSAIKPTVPPYQLRVSVHSLIGDRREAKENLSLIKSSPEQSRRSHALRQQ